MLTILKKQIQEKLATVAKFAHRLGLTPNSVSAIGFCLSIFAAVAYAVSSTQQPLLLLVGVILLLSSGFCDTLDGILARTYQQASPFGGFLDSMLDRYADVLILAGVIVSGLCNLIAGIIALVGSMMVSYSRARAEAAGIKMESIGLVERPERMLILAATSLIAIFWMPALNIGIIILAILANFTVLQRAHHVYKTMKNKNKTGKEV
ncbi:MAG: CDP-alcohol phosphatidyltransferase family protein [Crenarchaeota archaeon]|nr:CDP-alcohol phosphatidyltransferase family protein [Thermoproteota archaeon]